MKDITITGRIGKNAEVITSKTGTKWAKFSVAVNEYRNRENKTYWFDVTMSMESISDKLFQSLVKGRLVVVTGDFDLENIVSAKNGKMYVNLRMRGYQVHFISTNSQSNKDSNDGTASKIEEFTPSSGLSPETPSVVSPTIGGQEEAQVNPPYASVKEDNVADDDDLPF